MKIRINLLYQFAVLNTVLWAYWAGDLLAQAGHRIDRTANRVVVSESSQWKKWKFADGTLQISPQGEIGPSRVQKNTNAVLNIVDFLRFRPPEYLSKKEPEDIVLLDAIQGGSNRVEVINALDGDLATFWEPDRVDPNTDLSIWDALFLSRRSR